MNIYEHIQNMGSLVAPMIFCGLPASSSAAPTFKGGCGPTTWLPVSLQLCLVQDPGACQDPGPWIQHRILNPGH